MSGEVLPSLNLAAKELKEKERVERFSNINYSIPVVKTVLSLLRASVLAMKEAGGASAVDQLQISSALNTLGQTQSQLGGMNQTATQTQLFCEVNEFFQNLESNRQYFSQKMQGPGPGDYSPEDLARLRECLTTLKQQSAQVEQAITENRPTPLQSLVREWIQTLAPINLMIIESWARANDLRSSYARVYGELIQYLEGI